MSNIGRMFIAAAQKDRGIWVPLYDTEVVSEYGQEWPTAVIVTKWEQNYLGEKRYVDTRVYAAPAEEVAEGEGA